jgi:hypothetical protein
MCTRKKADEHDEREGARFVLDDFANFHQVIHRLKNNELIKDFSTILWKFFIAGGHNLALNFSKKKKEI